MLVGPFVRNPPGGGLATLMFRAALVRPWGPAAFRGYYPKWLPGERPEGYDEHTAAVAENLRRPGHWKAFVRTTRTTHAPAEARLDDVRAPGRGRDGHRRRRLEGPGRGGRAGSGTGSTPRW